MASDEIMSLDNIIAELEEGNLSQEEFNQVLSYLDNILPNDPTYVDETNLSPSGVSSPYTKFSEEDLLGMRGVEEVPPLPSYGTLDASLDAIKGLGVGVIDSLGNLALGATDFLTAGQVIDYEDYLTPEDWNLGRYGNIAASISESATDVGTLIASAGISSAAKAGTVGASLSKTPKLAKALTPKPLPALQAYKQYEEVKKGLVHQGMNQGLSKDVAEEGANIGALASSAVEYVGDLIPLKSLKTVKNKSVLAGKLGSGAAKEGAKSSVSPVIKKLDSNNAITKFVYDSPQATKVTGGIVVDANKANKILHGAIIKNAAKDILGESATEAIQGRLEQLGLYSVDPNMKAEEIYKGWEEDALWGGVGAGVIHSLLNTPRIVSKLRNNPTLSNTEYMVGDILDEKGDVVANIANFSRKESVHEDAGVRYDPETDEISVPAKIKYPTKADSIILVDSEGVARIAPSKDSQDPVKQLELTREAILKSQDVKDSLIDPLKKIPGSTDRENFGKMSEGTENVDDIFGKEDIINDSKEKFTKLKDDAKGFIKDRTTFVGNNKLEAENRGILKGKLPETGVSSNHVLQAIKRAAKDALDVELDLDLSTEGMSGLPATKSAGKADTYGGRVSIRGDLQQDSGVHVALHELAHVIANSGKRLTTDNSFFKFLENNQVSKRAFNAEMRAVKKMLSSPAEYGIDPAIAKRIAYYEGYAKKAVPEEVFVDSFAGMIMGIAGFSEKFDKVAPKTSKALSEYLKDNNMTDALGKISKIYKAYSTQDFQKQMESNTNARQMSLSRKALQKIWKFIGPRNKVASILTKTIDDMAMIRHVGKELSLPNIGDNLEFTRGRLSSATQAFMSGNGMKGHHSDIAGYTNFDSIFKKVNGLNNGNFRFSTYMQALNTLGELLGNHHITSKFLQAQELSGMTTKEFLYHVIEDSKSTKYNVELAMTVPTYTDLVDHFIDKNTFDVDASELATSLSVQEAVDYIDSQRGLEDFNDLQSAVEDYVKAWEHARDYVASISPEMALYVEYLRNFGAGYYVPLTREMLGETTEDTYKGKVRTGSSRTTINLYENTANALQNLFSKAQRSATKLAISEFAKQRGGGVYVKQIVPPKEAISIESIQRELSGKLTKKTNALLQKELKSLTEEAAVLYLDKYDASPIVTADGDYIMGVIEPYTYDKKGGGVTNVLKYYKIDPALYEAIKTPTESSGYYKTIVDAMDTMNGMIKEGYTSYNPFFLVVTNPLRDMWNLAMRGNIKLWDTDNELVKNNIVNSLLGSIFGMSHVAWMAVVEPKTFQKYQEMANKLGISTNKIHNEYKAILSRTSPSIDTPNTKLGVIMKAKQFFEHLQKSDMLARIAELEYLMNHSKDANDNPMDTEELDVSPDTVWGLNLSKKKLRSLGMEESIIDTVLTPEQREIYKNTPSTATLYLDLSEDQKDLLQSLHEDEGFVVRDETYLSDDQVVQIQREVALCTTDFLRHGAVSDSLNHFFLFARAGINGFSQLGSWYSRRKEQGREKEVYGKLISSAILGGVMSLLFGDDDEEPEQYWNGFRFRVGDFTFDMPMMPEDSIAFNAGRYLVKGESGKKFITDMITHTIPTFGLGVVGIGASVVSGKRLNNPFQSNFAEPIVSPYLKEKYGDALDKIINNNTSYLARIMPNIFGMTPIDWQYILTSSGVGWFDKVIESAAGVDRSVIGTSGEIAFAGQGFFKTLANMIGINKPLYKTKSEARLEELFSEARSQHTLNPDDKDLEAKYLLLYNATNLQKELLKGMLLASTPEQYEALLKARTTTANVSLNAIGESTMPVEDLRTMRRIAANFNEVEKEEIAGRDSKEFSNKIDRDYKESRGSVFKDVAKDLLDELNVLSVKDAEAETVESNLKTVDKTFEKEFKGRTDLEEEHLGTALVETGKTEIDYGSIYNNRYGPNHLLGAEMKTFVSRIAGGDRTVTINTGTGSTTKQASPYEMTKEFYTELKNNPAVLSHFTADEIGTQKFNAAYKYLAEKEWFKTAYRKYVNSMYGGSKSLLPKYKDNDAILEMAYSMRNHAGKNTRAISSVTTASSARNYLRKLIDAVDKNPSTSRSKTRHLEELYIYGKYLKHLEDTKKSSDPAEKLKIIKDFAKKRKADSTNPTKHLVNKEYVNFTLDEMEKEIWGGKK